MEASPKVQMTLRQAIAGKWQVPLFIASLVTFVGVLVYIRPREVRLTFEQRYAELEGLAEQGRYEEFYRKAEALRQDSETQAQLGRVHLLAAQTRVRELEQRHELGVDQGVRQSAESNYHHIIGDYREAMRRAVIDPNSPEGGTVYRDISLAYWGLNEAEKAIQFLERAIQLRGGYDPFLYRSLVRMLLTSRPKGYLKKSLELLEGMLGHAETPADEKAWAYVRKAEVLIGLGREDDALVMLNAVDETLKKSAYSEELLLMRGRALRRAGKVDEADLLLRDLLGTMRDQGDIYAQVLLELGKLNYGEFRDKEAERYFRRVVETQLGSDWYVAGLLGLAECAALQQRYPAALGLYQEVVDQLQMHPHNWAVDRKTVQQSLALLAHDLNLMKQYETALAVLEIEQQVAPADDLEATLRLAWAYRRLAEQMAARLSEAEREEAGREPSETEKKWRKQQKRLIKGYFEHAAEQFLRATRFITGDDSLYGESLWEAANSYDKAGNAEKAITVWLRFVQEREGQPKWPRALFYLAQAHQALGHYDSAIEYYELLLAKHPNAPAAFESVVPLSQCYLNKEKPETDKARALLLSVFSNPAHNPPSRHFREALWALGELYYANGDYELAIKRLSEAIDRYPNDPALGKYLFLVGNSYRKIGLALDTFLAQLADDPTATVNRERASAQRRQYLGSARDYFEKAIAFYEKIPEGRRTELDRLYLRHSWMYRGDCEFDLGRYAEAVSVYEEVALRYQLTPTALQALMQIVNCHVRLGNQKEAGVANRRALWQLEKMSDAELAAAPVGKDRAAWKAWFQWMEQAGLW